MRVRGPVLQHNEGAVRIPHLSRCSPQLTLASSAASRRPLPHAPPCSIDAPFKAPCRRRRARPRALVRPRCCRRPRRRRPAPDTPYKHPLSLLLLPPICLSRRHRPSTPHRPVCRERVRMRKKWRAGCVARAHRSNDPDHSFAAAAPAALVAWPKSIDVPLSGPKRQDSCSEKGHAARARSTRGTGGRQPLPRPWPIGAALAQAPDRSRRRPGSVLHCRTVA